MAPQAVGCEIVKLRGGQSASSFRLQVLEILGLGGDGEGEVAAVRRKTLLKLKAL